ncbi:MAG: metallophosphoesterase [Planctomycetota bacterium]
MWIVAVSDLHYDQRREPAVECAKKVIASDAVVLVIAGDFAMDENLIDECAALFDPFVGYKIAVAGNHDLWVYKGNSSLQRYKRLGEILRAHDFHFLDESPMIIGNIGFVGNIGWYDYSFRRLDAPEPYVQVLTDRPKKWEDLTEEDYKRKILYYTLTRSEKSLDVFGKNLRVTGWNDIEYIRWDYADAEFTNICVEKLRRDIAQIEPLVEKIIAVTHHLPFENMMIRKNRVDWDFNNAFVGSRKLGEVLLSCPKISLAICGHTHHPGIYYNRHIACYNAYTEPFVMGV